MKHTVLRAPFVVLLICWLITGCESTPPPQNNQATLPQPMLPSNPGAFSPAMSSLSKGVPYNLAQHSEIKLCESCHPGHATQWRESTHALSSFNNPFYRIAFDNYVDEVGVDKGAFCGGCHDPTLVFTGAIAKPIKPSQPEAHLGVTCNSCHGIIDATPDGVASYTLDTSPIPIPSEGDEKSLQEHINRVSRPILKQDTLCISCHKGFLSQASGHKVFLPALDEFGPWRRSGFSAPVTAARIVPPAASQGCRDCHMPEAKDENVLHSHRFAGGHTTLAQAANAPKQLAAIKNLMANRVALNIPAWRTGSGQWMATNSIQKPQSSEVEFDVVISNTGIGHHFPAGARDLRNVWLELTVSDSSGKTIATSGHQYGEVGEEADVHVLQVGLVDDNGILVKKHGVGHFRTPLFDQTIAPSDSRAARYAFAASPATLWPLTLKARLLQKRYTKSFFDEACRASKTPRGQAFQEFSKKLHGLKMDACEPQPTIVMAEASSFIGKVETSKTPEWLRWYRHGLALQHDLQERLSHAAQSLRNALKVLPETITGHRRSMIHASLGEVLVKQSKLKEANEQLDIADKLTPNQPVIARLRGQGLRKIWKIKEAIPHFKKAARLAPGDEARWRDLAAALGSVGEHREALEAAQKGLAVEPRDTHLLRLQMLAIEKSGNADSEEARKTFLNYKLDEAAPGVRSRCSDRSPECRKARLPLRTYRLNMDFK